MVPDSKTEPGRRWVPISDRVSAILRTRCGNRSEGWVWPSRNHKGKHIGPKMVNQQWNRAREKAGLPKELVLYCARHDYGTSVMQKTGNLKLVMQVMGHSDVATAVRYQHPGMELVRAAINDRNETSGNFTAGFTPKIPDGKQQPSVSY